MLEYWRREGLPRINTVREGGRVPCLVRDCGQVYWHVNGGRGGTKERGLRSIRTQTWGDAQKKRGRGSSLYACRWGWGRGSDIPRLSASFEVKEWELGGRSLVQVVRTSVMGEGEGQKAGRTAFACPLFCKGGLLVRASTGAGGGAKREELTAFARPLCSKRTGGGTNQGEQTWEEGEQRKEGGRVQKRLRRCGAYPKRSP
jgi:hypothetical protein